MTDRPTAATITDAQLAELYADLDRYEEVQGEMNERAIRQERDLGALRQVARGYCPACGRGDAAPTVADWEQQKTRADQAEADRDTARQHAAAIAAQRDRLRQRMNNLADRWDTALAPDKAYARALRAEISVAPFNLDGAMAVREYTERGRRLWAFRCWGTETCDGWLGLGHETQTSALAERERHVAEAHGEHAATAPAPGPCPACRRADQAGLAPTEQHDDCAQQQPAHDAGPDVAECAAADRNWDVQKAGE